MNARLPSSRMYACVMALLLLPQAAWAGQVTISPGAGNITAILEHDASIFVDATRAVLVHELPSAIGHGRVMHKIKAKTLAATLARVEYTYDKDGQTHTRVYHARSGHSVRRTLDSLNNASTGSSETGDSTAGGSETGSDAGPLLADDIARDASEAIYYAPDTATDVRAPNLPSEGSMLTALEPDHARDAELKAFRKIEDDINKGIVTRGGRFTGYVSKTVCASCRKAMETFAETYDANGEIYEMIEATKDQTEFPATMRGMSQRASAELRIARKRYTQANLGARNVTTPRIGTWEEPVSVLRLEDEEAGLAAGDAPECAE